ncbi:hypothetical protein O9187_02835, partial [Treponema pallidum]
PQTAFLSVLKEASDA